MGENVDRLFSVCDVLNTTRDANGRIKYQVGDVKNAVVDTDDVSAMQQPGFASRPSSPTAGKAACQSLVFHRGSRDIIVASTDARCAAIAGTLGPGESCAFAGGVDGKGQARTLWKGDGSVNHYTRVGNSPTGAGMLMQLDAANNAARVLQGLGYGMIADASGVTITASNAAVTLKAGGAISIVGTGAMQVDGTSIVLGGSPALNPVTNGVVVNPAAIIAVLAQLVAAITAATCAAPGSPIVAPLLVPVSAAITALGAPGGIKATKVLAE